MPRRVEDRNYPLELIGAIARQDAAAVDQKVDDLTAADIAFDNSGGSLSASDVQSAITELEAGLGAGVDPNLLLHLQWAQKVHFKKYTYSLLTGDLELQEIFEDNTETVKLFNIAYTYSGGSLTQIDVERISDSATLTKVFTYSGGNLESIEVT